MTEPDVTLTDYALALECAALAALLARRETRDPALRTWWVVFFAAASAAPLFGGTVHGFFLDEEQLGHAILWPASLLAIGVAALAAWAIGAKLLFGPRAAFWVVVAAAAQFAVYAVWVLAVSDRFLVAILAYAPATAFVLVAFAAHWRRSRSRAPLLGCLGLLVTFLAALVQQLGIGLHPRYFNHNAVYHALQGAAFVLLFVGARFTLGAAPR